MSFDSGGKGGSDGGKAKKGGFLDGLRSFGADFANAFARNMGASTEQGSKPSVDRRDPVAVRDRPIAARQIQRRLKIERKAADEEAGKQDAAPQAAEEQLQEESSAGGVDPAEQDASASDASDEVSADSAEAGGQDAVAPDSGPTAEATDKEQGVPTSEEAKPSMSVAAKLKGVHRKVFLAPIVTAGGGGGGRRPNDGLNVKPILGKLDQAHSMFVMWAQKGTVPEAQAMLAALGAAKDKAHELDERVEGGKIEAIDRLKSDLAQRLQSIQKLDPGYELFSVGAMAITVTLATRRMQPAVAPPPWICNQPASLAAYRAALQRQQDGINAMMSDQWKGNKDQYTKVGRSDEGTGQQKEFGRRTKAPGAKSPGDAPHNPDQIGAGYPDPTGLPDPAYVNRSIGSYWAKDNRDGVIENAVNAIHPLTRLVTQMNVVLTVA